MVITKKANIRVVKSNIEHFEKLGYDVKIYDVLYVPISQLTNGCKAKIEVQCDYCKKIITKTYKQLANERKNSITKKDCCNSCTYIKRTESNLFLYGVENPAQRKDVQEKMKKTCRERYGVDNPTKNKSISNKVSKKLKNKTVSQKIKIKEKKEKTCSERYGVLCTFNTAKSRKNLFKTQSKESRPQRETFGILKKEYGSLINSNVSYSKLSLDMLLVVENIKIDIEYDSSYWHEPNRDRKRDEFLKLNGFKILRIKSGKEIPEKKDLVDKIEFLLDSDHSYSELILKDWNEAQYKEKGRQNE